MTVAVTVTTEGAGGDVHVDDTEVLVVDGGVVLVALPRAKALAWKAAKVFPVVGALAAKTIPLVAQWENGLV